MNRKYEDVKIVAQIKLFHLNLNNFWGTLNGIGTHSEQNVKTKKEKKELKMGRFKSDYDCNFSGIVRTMTQLFSMNFE